MTPQLWSTRFSPWTLRVKWCLKSLDFEYDTVEYRLPAGAWQLRLKTWRWTNTVPVLDTGKELLTDGLDIVRYADDASNPKMLINGFEEWMELANAVMGMLRCARVRARHESLVLNGKIVKRQIDDRSYHYCFSFFYSSPASDVNYIVMHL